MYTRFIIPALAFLILGVPATGQAQKDDPVAAQLRKDKEAYVAAILKAKGELLKEFDRQYELVKADKTMKVDVQLALLQGLEAEKKAFDQTGRLPVSLQMKVGVSEYLSTGKRAVEACKAAYETAAKAYVAKGDTQPARAWLDEGRAFFAAPAAPAPAAGTSVFVIQSKWSGKVLTPRDRDSAENTKLVQMDYVKGDETQMWRAVPSEDGWYFLENVKTGLAMGVHRDGKNNGAEVVTVPKRVGSDYQQWKPVPVPNDKGIFRFVNRGSGKNFGVDAKSLNSGARILIWTEEDHDAQRFGIIAIQK